MYALREIHQITSNTVTIQVPEAFKNRQVEILLLPLDETTSPVTVPNKEWPPDFFAKTAGCLADDPIERAPQCDITLTPKQSHQKPFTIRQFSLGKEVELDRALNN